ncbi:MAG TPA: YihY/virulence factor BrkB family protein [Flavipsychrobacter sp.]
MKKLKLYWQMLKEAFQEFSDDNVMKLSASLAYYTAFSLGPLLLVVISVTGFFFETNDVMWSVYWQMEELVGKSSADQLFTIIQQLRDQNAKTFSIIGIVILIFGATTVFADIQDSINYIWSIKAKPQRGWLKYLQNRLLSFSLVLGIAFLLIVSLFVSSLTDILSKSLFRTLQDELVVLIQIFNLLFTFVIITLLFASIYKFLPDAVIRWKDAMRGAFFTGLLFMLGKYLISLYISSSEMDNTYGAAASIIIILSWVYYTAIILYFGAEFTKVYAMQAGGKIKLKGSAVFIIKKESEVLPKNETMELRKTREK